MFLFIGKKKLCDDIDISEKIDKLRIDISVCEHIFYLLVRRQDKRNMYIHGHSKHNKTKI